MLDSLELFQIWFELECIGFDDDNRLMQTPGSTCDDVEHVVVAEFSFGPRAFVSRELNDWVARGILMLPDEVLTDENKVKGIVYAFYPEIEVRKETTYKLEASSIDTPDVTFLGDTKDTFDTFAVIQDGQIVSRAWSVRRNYRAAEIAVETTESHRRKGYGRQVVAAWAHHQHSLGKVGIYSHRDGNIESQALAKSAFARQFVRVVSYY